MTCCEENNIQALGGSSTFLTAMTFWYNTTMANHHVFHKFKLERSWILTIVTHLFTQQEILQIENETNSTHADG